MIEIDKFGELVNEIEESLIEIKKEIRETAYVKGGRGNARLLSWSSSRDETGKEILVSMHCNANTNDYKEDSNAKRIQFEINKQKEVEVEVRNLIIDDEIYKEYREMFKTKLKHRLILFIMNIISNEEIFDKLSDSIYKDKFGIGE